MGYPWNMGVAHFGIADLPECGCINIFLRQDCKTRKQEKDKQGKAIAVFHCEFFLI